MDQTQAWSSTYMMKLFADAIAREEIPDRRVEDFYFSQVGKTLQATLRNELTGQVELWEIDLRTGHPKPSCFCGKST